MMNKFFFFLVILFFSVQGLLLSQNSWKFEHYTYFNSGVRQSFTLTGRQALTGRMGFDTYVTVKNNMGGGTLGLDYKLTPWLMAGVLVGWDIQLSSIVLIPNMVIKKNKFLFTAAYLRIGEVLDLFELAMHYEGKNMKVGAIARNYFGVGPRVDLRIPRTPAYLWVAGLYEWKKETYGLMTGLIIPMAASSSVK